jgi:hypothetical protein
MEAGRGSLALGEDDGGPETPGHYQRHRPEETLLYQIITQYYNGERSAIVEHGLSAVRAIRNGRPIPSAFRVAPLSGATRSTAHPPVPINPSQRITE